MLGVCNQMIGDRNEAIRYVFSSGIECVLWWDRMCSLVG